MLTPYSCIRSVTLRLHLHAAQTQSVFIDDPIHPTIKEVEVSGQPAFALYHVAYL